jgi:cbb3-type cytochrome oxidase subunit 3
MFLSILFGIIFFIIVLYIVLRKTKKKEVAGRKE